MVWSLMFLLVVTIVAAGFSTQQQRLVAVDAFQVVAHTTRIQQPTVTTSLGTNSRRKASTWTLSRTRSTLTSTSTTSLYDSTQVVETYLNEMYPAFMSMIMSKNEDVWKQLRKAEKEVGGYTIFVVSDDVMLSGSGDGALTEKQRTQIQDVRNGETIEKIAAYHAINEPVSEVELYNAGGIITLGGELPIAPSISGGFMGIGGKEDGGVTVNGAKVLSTQVIDECCTIHQVDRFVSPKLLWRYMDQLRIPGSK